MKNISFFLSNTLKILAVVFMIEIGILSMGPSNILSGDFLKVIVIIISLLFWVSHMLFVVSNTQKISTLSAYIFLFFSLLSFLYAILVVVFLMMGALFPILTGLPSQAISLEMSLFVFGLAAFLVPVSILGAIARLLIKYNISS